MVKKRATAGELSKKAFADTTKYNALEVGHALADDIDKHIDECLQLHLNYTDAEGNYSFRQLDEFCVVMVIAKDNMIKNVVRRKFYCSPFLPSPRPNQAVFLYKRADNRIVKRLWVLPSDMVMAELTSMAVVHKRYQTMQAWAMAFFQGTFWEYIRHEHGISMLSQHEYLLKHREELIKSGCKLFDPNSAEAFDFSKIHIKNVIDTQEAVV